MSDQNFENEFMDFFSAGKEARRVHGGEENGEMENRSEGTRSYGPVEGQKSRKSQRDRRAAQTPPVEEPEEFAPVPEPEVVSEPETVVEAEEIPEPEVVAEAEEIPEPEAVSEPAEIPQPDADLLKIPTPEVDEILREQAAVAEPAPKSVNAAPVPAAPAKEASAPAAPEKPKASQAPQEDFRASFRAGSRKRSDDMSELEAALLAGVASFGTESAVKKEAAASGEDATMAALREALLGGGDDAPVTPQEAALLNRLDAQQTQTAPAAQDRQPEQQPEKPAAQPKQPKPQKHGKKSKQAKQAKQAKKPAPAEKAAPAKSAKPDSQKPAKPEAKPKAKTEPKNQKPAPQKKKQKNEKKGRKAGLTIAVIAAVLCLAVVGSAFAVSQRQTVFPKVTMQGEDLSGLTVQEAENTVKSAGWDGADGTILQVQLPGELTMDVHGRDIGWRATAAETAQAAWDYGRDGNFLQNLVTFVRTAISGHEISDDLLPEPDTSELRKEVKKSVDEANEAMSDGNLEIDTDAKLIRFVKGGDLFAVETEEVYTRVLEAIENHEKSISCVKKVSEDSEVKDLDMQALHDEVCREPENAKYDPEKKEVVEGVPGVEFDVEEAHKIWAKAKAGEVVKIPIVVTEPSFHKSDVTELFQDKLASKTTSLSGSSAARINNITLAAAKINGVVLDPGQTFSYNDTVGQRTTARGFREAGAYANGEVVSEVGGGICQVSSTLYYTAMMSNLKITARTAHYFSVGYIEPGMDATVSWGAPDFRFENDRTFPIKIVANVTGNSVNVEIWGTDVDHSTVKMDSTTSGMTTTTFRNVYDKDGQLLSRTQEAVSTYHAHETVRPTTAPAPVRTATPTVTTPTPAAPTPVPTPTPVEPTAEPVPDEPDVDTLDDTIVD